jgi:hypothetical protein
VADVGVERAVDACSVTWPEKTSLLTPSCWSRYSRGVS